MDDLESLRQALNDLEAMPLIDQARAIPGLIDQARETLAQRRGAVFAALAGPGRPMTIAALAKELGIHRSKVDDAIKAHRDALGTAPAGERRMTEAERAERHRDARYTVLGPAPESGDSGAGKRS